VRILWFTNTPGLSKEMLNAATYGGFWIDSLQERIEKERECILGIAFYFNKPVAPFELNGTFYFPLLKPKKSKIGSIISQLQHQILSEDEVMPQYLEVINSFQPDLIHVWGTENSFGLITTYVKIPVLIWMQGIISVISENLFTTLQPWQFLLYTNKIKLLKGDGSYHGYKRLLKRVPVEKKILSNSRFIAGRTEWDHRVTRVLAPQSQYFHCDEMLRDVFFQNNWLPHTHEVFKVCSVLTAHSFKGIDTIIDSMKYLKEILDERISWDIIGAYENEDVIQILKRKNRIASFSDCGITFKGVLHGELLINELCNSDLFVHPSNIENSPNSICEAMVLGMPTIACFAGGISSLIDDGKEGILFQPRDSRSLAGAVLDLCKNRDKAVIMGQNARIRAIKRHNHEAIYRNIISIYHTIIKT
jgi:glycosyltransferase involved in cell wall biosynthesis